MSDHVSAEKHRPVARASGAHDELGRLGNACDLNAAALLSQPRLTLLPNSEASQVGYGPLPSVKACVERGLNRFLGHMEVLAGVWDVPIAGAANAIKEARNDRYGAMAKFVLPRLFVGVFALPRLAAYRASVIAQQLLERGATETTIQRVFSHANTSEVTTITFRKYQLPEAGQNNIIYHVFVDETYCLRWKATKGVPINEFEEALWEYVTKIIL